MMNIHLADGAHADILHIQLQLPILLKKRRIMNTLEKTLNIFDPNFLTTKVKHMEVVLSTPRHTMFTNIEGEPGFDKKTPCKTNHSHSTGCDFQPPDNQRKVFSL